MATYKAKNNDVYGEMEESILACLLLKPELMEQLKVSEIHFKRFGYVLTFFKTFYEKYKTLDVAIMFTIVKGTSEQKLMDIFLYLSDLVVFPNRFEVYQRRLIYFYTLSKKDDWLRQKIYEKATKLYVGTINPKMFKDDIEKLFEQANKIEWK